MENLCEVQGRPLKLGEGGELVVMMVLVMVMVIGDAAADDDDDYEQVCG